MSSRRNPNAPARPDVLTVSDLRSDMSVVIHFVLSSGRTVWRSWATIVSVRPDLRRVTVLYGEKGKRKELKASEMGVAPNKHGEWSSNYTTLKP